MKAMILHHDSSCTHYGSILPFCNSILLWSVRKWKLPLYPLVSAILIKLLGGILTPIIWFEYSDSPPCLVPPELWTPGTSSRLLLTSCSSWINSGLPGIVINECDIVLKSCQRGKWHGTTQVWMNQIKHSLLSTIIARKSSLGVLSQSTPFAYTTLLCTEIWQTSGHVSQHPQSWIMKVGHPPVP